MSRDKHLPLTETVYYILLSLLEPAHGYLIMKKVEDLSKGEIKMAAGTLYGAIENLLKLKLIEPVHSPDKRRKIYLITQTGRVVLQQDFERIQHMVQLTEKAFTER
ncbi:helix-turn-helix transcriptional regulator [Hazenella sp. IB182357]|uniref:Helix-turn-helix transcriptional regulator n=1 Tax=Polycladospora coralii TaxID=2771432 RepID=A0A926NAW2_9BACL|nr:helix-turn-helix transcriptional regulator [Polycladospora coralii]MBD1371885.1 helix-turn-helix transcriptional regulator [Polycladospora coralii]MBS7529346.1 helix-turn-helix transcriptional regulator [Polycladospora coralii]